MTAGTAKLSRLRNGTLIKDMLCKLAVLNELCFLFKGFQICDAAISLFDEV